MPYLATGEVTAHRVLSRNPDGSTADVESVILVPGQTLEDDEVPEYVKADVESGKLTLLKKVNKSEAKKAQADAEAAVAEAEEEVYDANPETE